MIGSDPGPFRPPLLTIDEPDAAAAETPHASVFASLGLIANPFPNDPGAGPFIEAANHTAALDQLNTWWSDPAGGSLAVVTGESGSGKSRVLIEFRNVVANDNTTTIAVLADRGQRRSDAQLLRDIVSAFGGAPNGRTGLELQGEVRQQVLGIAEAGDRSLVLIDAANFSGSQLEILRSLLTDSPARIVLFGAPDLPDRIIRRRSLAAFVGLAVQIDPITDDELIEIIRQRVAVNQASTSELAIQPDALTTVATLARGNPGIATRLMHATLIEALASGRHHIDRDLIAQAQRAVEEQGVPQMGTDAADIVIQTRFQLPGFESIATPPTERRRRTRQTGGA
jgi:type II secretory pathway predicted ATPase ExeA